MSLLGKIAVPSFWVIVLYCIASQHGLLIFKNLDQVKLAHFLPPAGKSFASKVIAWKVLLLLLFENAVDEALQPGRHRCQCQSLAPLLTKHTRPSPPTTAAHGHLTRLGDQRTRNGNLGTSPPTPRLANQSTGNIVAIDPEG